MQTIVRCVNIIPFFLGTKTAASGRNHLMHKDDQTTSLAEPAFLLKPEPFEGGSSSTQKKCTGTGTVQTKNISKT